jgi:hypothetical protein
LDKLFNLIVPPNFSLASDSKYRAFIDFTRSLLDNHTYINMLRVPSLSNPRFLHWIDIVNQILLTLIVNTLFYQVFYTNDGTCNTYVTYTSCLASYNAATNEPTCTWESTSSTTDENTDGNCSLRPPPSTIVFQFTLSLLTVVISTPISIVTSLIINELKREPKWERLQQQTHSICSFFFSLLRHSKKEKEHREEKVRSDAKISRIVTAIAAREDHQQHDQPIHYSSVTEEWMVLQVKIQIHFEECYQIPWYDHGRDRNRSVPAVPVVEPLSFQQEYECRRQMLQSRSDVIFQLLGISPHGKLRPFSWLDWWFYGNYTSKQLAFLRKIRSKEHKIHDMLIKFHPSLISSNDYFLQDAALLHFFLLEQLTSFQQ